MLARITAVLQAVYKITSSYIKILTEDGKQKVTLHCLVGFKISIYSANIMVGIQEHVYTVNNTLYHA